MGGEEKDGSVDRLLLLLHKGDDGDTKLKQSQVKSRQKMMLFMTITLPPLSGTCGFLVLSVLRNVCIVYASLRGAEHVV